MWCAACIEYRSISLRLLRTHWFCVRRFCRSFLATPLQRDAVVLNIPQLTVAQPRSGSPRLDDGVGAKRQAKKPEETHGFQGNNSGSIVMTKNTRWMANDAAPRFVEAAILANR